MEKKKPKKEEWVDDGRIIANMNVDGMPGTLRRPVRRRPERDAFGKVAQKPEPVALTKGEKKVISRGVTWAFVAVMLIFCALITLVALFVSKVWFA